MLQALIKKGRVLPTEVPAPVVSKGSVLIKVVHSCISAGTELQGVQGSGKSLIRQAMEQPEKVRRVLDMARSDGIARTLARIRGQLDTGSPTGYSVSGIVLATGEGIHDLQPGDRVAAAGAGIANHAEFVDVPRNLVMRIPEGLGFRAAATVTLGGIAMQGVRRAAVQLGEYVVVFGAGILGQLALQMLVASGCRAIAVDLDPDRLALAREMGAELCIDPGSDHAVKTIHHFTGGHGADVVLFCAATNNPQALSDALAMTRKKGRLVMVGVWGQELRREDLYAKEIDFLISTSYGPGRYDSDYEVRGIDYPYAYVRWTENRNMEEYLRLLSKSSVRVEPLIQATYPLAEVEQAFASLQGPKRPLMVLLDYGTTLPPDYRALEPQARIVFNPAARAVVGRSRIRTAILGAGSFATATHLPNLKKLGKHFEIRAICSRTGSKAQAVARQFDATYATTDYREVLDDPDVDLVMICTRHNLHGPMVLECLKAGKHTFVEKPLCTSPTDLDAIKAFFVETAASAEKASCGSLPLLMVGFNRRFSRYAAEVKRHVRARVNPLFLLYRMNAGLIPPGHWVHTEEGGGRIIGEACHVIDLFAFLTESPVRACAAASLRPHGASLSSSDNKSLVIEYEDGSVATLEYFSVGSKALPKERLEVHFDEKSILVDDYKSIQGYGVQTASFQDPIPEKGQLEELQTLAEYLERRSGAWPIPLDQLIETTEVTLKLAH